MRNSIKMNNEESFGIVGDFYSELFYWSFESFPFVNYNWQDKYCNRRRNKY